VRLLLLIVHEHADGGHSVAITMRLKSSGAI
jgi:hypothetical protein